MPTDAGFDRAWHALAPAFRACMEQAWLSLCRGGLPVGAVMAKGDHVLSRGRNRVYDPPGGSDPLQATALAHAEMNALATVPADADLTQCRMWSTQEPCSMCAAAIEFTAVAGVAYLASDPSSEPPAPFVSSGNADDVWIVVANTMFLHNVIRVGGADNPMLERNRAYEPEVVELARRLVDQRSLTKPADRGAPLVDALDQAWDGIREASTRRRRRSRAGPR